MSNGVRNAAQTLYIHILKWKDRGLFLPITDRKVVKAQMFEGKQPVTVTRTKTGVMLELPAVPSGVDTIVELTLK